MNIPTYVDQKGVEKIFKEAGLQLVNFEIPLSKGQSNKNGTLKVRISPFN